ncbi:MAG: transpeptidase family protein [Prevotella sp.]|nr:transpeptidase family protein [Prevotella sp.]
MSKFDNNKTIPRYSFIAIIITLIGVLVLVKALYIMTAKHDYWMDVAKKQKLDSLVVKPNRGNILSDEGELMASSLPEYKMFMDFKVGGEKKDSLWREKVDSICMGLHEIFPEKSAEEFKADLEKGHAKMSQNWPIWPKRVDYNTFVKVKQLPIFNMPKLRGGFHYEENNARRRPFGTLAQRTVGDMYGAKDTARFGLELSFDSILRGKTGITHKRKVMNKFLSFVDIPPTDGDDIQTTINVQMQDIAEKAVEEELKLINGDVGVAIVMEVATGDVKAIVNLEKCGDGQYRERRNHAVSDLLEPGSVFKTASVMVALDDGLVDTAHRVNTGNGQMMMHGAQMNDHNRASGGYGTISLGRALQVSSNIGISKVIDECYKSNPERYVDGLYRIGIAEDLQVPITGSTPPRIRKPQKNSHGNYTNWSLTTLPWMSIGYETQVPPISTLTFYNAIANNGKMMKPRFVTRVLREGQVIAEYPPVVLRHQICKPSTLAQIQDLLCKVVTNGTGKKAKSESFLVAGKTGTAQISKGRGGYKSGVMHYLVSFVGYFPADAPRYSCIVCLQKAGLPASGGTMSGWVFHNISEGVMAHNLNMDISNARDSLQERRPKAMSGDLKAASMVLGHLGFDTQRQWGDNNSDQSFWGSVALGGTQYILKQKERESDNIVPNVRGMGARDAIYQMERRGIKTKVVGRGKVRSQSLAPGEKVVRGSVCTLTMQYQ